MQVAVEGKCDVRRPKLKEVVCFTIGEDGQLICHPRGVSVDVCELLLNRGDQLHFDFVPFQLAERLRSCSIMTVEYLGNGQARDIHDRQALTFSLRHFADHDDPLTATVSHLAKSILESYPNVEDLAFAEEKGVGI